MCGKYHVSTEDENLSFREAIHQLMLEHPEIVLQTQAVVPSQVAPVYTRQGLAPLRFGHQASFLKRLLINARSETAPTSPMFAPLLRTARVLVPAGGFYEWSAQKQPFLFGLPAGGLLYMAGLAFPGQPVPGFVILTRQATGAPGQVHDRMPVIFHSPELQQAWLQQDSLAQELLQLPDPGEYRVLNLAG